MSLATRCTACGTVFRVVQDQLKVSEGWVRCGRCQEVFNALEGLFDLDREGASAQRAIDPPGAASAPGAAQALPSPPPAAHAADDAVGPSIGSHAPFEAAGAISIAPFTSQPVTAQPGERSTEEADPRPLAVADDTHEPTASTDVERSSPEPSNGVADPESELGDDGDFADARFNTALLDDAAATDAALASAAVADGRLEGAAAMPPVVADEPAFLRQAGREALWRRPGVRRSMVMIAGVLVVTLVLQIAIHFHDGIAARWPSLRDSMNVVCAIADCEVEPPRRLDAVSVDSSGLVRVGESEADGYRLSLSLRNNAEHAVAPPSIELSLTNANGQLIARRVLAPADFAFVPPVLPPHVETSLQTVLVTAGERISGYTIEIFYP